MKISILVRCYNEEKNIKDMATTLTNIMKNNLSSYDYEIVFRDNNSSDRSPQILRDLASVDNHIKVILNARNYGLDTRKDTFVGRISGDVAIIIPCDFQEPPELIPHFVKQYEMGYEIVAGQKISSAEEGIRYRLRQLYYRIIDVFSDEKIQIKNLSGIILLSRRILELYWNNNYFEDLRYFVTDLGCNIKLIPYRQAKRRNGKSSFNLGRYLSFSISSLIDTSTIPLRIATIAGGFFSCISFLVGLVYLILKLIWWDTFPAGVAPTMIGLFFLGSVQLLFIGIVGEYVAAIFKRVTPDNPPIVRNLINFDNADNDPYLIMDPDDKGSI